MGFRITKVYTRQGDDGTTRLGGGQVVDKDHVRIEAYGTVDELNSTIGIALAFTPADKVKHALTRIQHELFTLGGDLCVLEEDKDKFKMKGIEPRHVTALENLIDELNGELQPLQEFILPGGGKVAAFLHQARCVCRRAERLLVSLGKLEEVNPQALKYLNRLSDALFVLARYQNFSQGTEDVYWQKEQS
ncbi:MAG: cob(I)yrinic acid a,c-diamide adenosyltransferase [Calditrichaeota bacterium]|nr:MAG: cob(I)yrinic acid a,c-diamide adenosyltransferase [Calditrichota bacterium]